MKLMYAIRHKPTGFYLPVGKGTTWREPADPELQPPRLFLTHKSAYHCLVNWLKGKWRATWDCGDSGDPYVDDIDITPVPSRKAEDMEIIAFNLVPINGHPD